MVLKDFLQREIEIVHNAGGQTVPLPEFRQGLIEAVELRKLVIELDLQCLTHVRCRPKIRA